MTLPSAADVSVIFTALALVITASASLVAAIASLLNARKIDRVEKATNGMKAELVESTRALAQVQGRLEGRAMQKMDDREKAVADAEANGGKK